MPTTPTETLTEILSYAYRVHDSINEHRTDPDGTEWLILNNGHAMAIAADGPASFGWAYYIPALGDPQQNTGSDHGTATDLEKAIARWAK